MLGGVSSGTGSCGFSRHKELCALSPVPTVGAAWAVRCQFLVTPVKSPPELQPVRVWAQPAGSEPEGAVGGQHLVSLGGEGSTTVLSESKGPSSHCCWLPGLWEGILGYLRGSGTV